MWVLDIQTLVLTDIRQVIYPLGHLLSCRHVCLFVCLFVSYFLTVTASKLRTHGSAQPVISHHFLGAQFSHTLFLSLSPKLISLLVIMVIELFVVSSIRSAIDENKHLGLSMACVLKTCLA